MKDKYDFSQGKRNQLISTKGKTRITLYLDDNILASFQEQAEAAGLGYQTLINQALQRYLKESIK